MIWVPGRGGAPLLRRAAAADRGRHSLTWDWPAAALLVLITLIMETLALR